MKLSNKSIKIEVFFILLTLLSLSGCRKHTKPKFERNPNLRLLISHADDRKSCFNPVWAPDGSKIYYLLTSPGRHPWEEGGQLRIIDVDGSNDRLVLDGKFGALAISPDGSKLALTADASSNEGGILILVNTNGSILDTVSTTALKVLDVEFGLDSSKLYYFAYEETSDSLDGFYEINLATSIENRVISLKKTPVFRGFDVSNSDSFLFYNSILYSIIDSDSQVYDVSYPGWPQFYPLSDEYVVYSGDYYALNQDLKVLNLATNSSTNLSAMPYEYSSFYTPSWSPNDNKIVFSGGIFDYEPPHPESFELWILEKVWE